MVFPVFSWPCNLRFRDGIFQCFLGRFLVLTESPVVLPEKEHVLPSMESWLINKDPYIMVLRTHISCSYSSVYIVLSSIIIPIFNYKTCVCVLSLHFQFWIIIFLQKHSVFYWSPSLKFVFVSWVKTDVFSTCLPSWLPDCLPSSQLLGGSSQWMYVANNYGDRKSPIPGVVPLPNGRTSWLINGGDPNYIRYLGWSSKWANDPDLTNIFQMGWNHQATFWP